MPPVRESRPPVRPASAVAVGALIGGLLGAVLLLVAEFTTLYDVRTSSGGLLVKSVSTGSNHSYAMVPIAVLAALLASVAFRAASRPALLALGVLGVLALLIALVGDLPSAHTSGLVGSPATHFQSASSRPSAGFYMETLGALVLLITCVCGFLMLGGPHPEPAAAASQR